MSQACRSCGSHQLSLVLDLGHQPPSNAYLNDKNLCEPEITYPLKVYICEKCWLMQAGQYTSADQLFTPDYAYLSSTSRSWLKHAKGYVDTVVQKLSLCSKSHVVELASNDGYLLQYFHDYNVPCTGIEPTSLAASISREKGITTLEAFFTRDLSETINKADLIIANNVLAHVPDINDFIAGMSILLKPDGLISIEFPHLLRLLLENQFDTIYHEHFSYISLGSLKRIVKRHGLEIIDVEQLHTHGGSLRVWVAHCGSKPVSPNVDKIFQLESRASLENLKTYSDFQHRALRVKLSLLDFLIKSKEANKTICAYGAAAKGNTLLNYSGVGNDLVPAVADLAVSKIGKYMPGSHIPIIHPKQLKEYSPDGLLVLPWNLINEISEQYSEYNLYTSIPTFARWN